MAGGAHEHPEFVNAAEFTVKITLTVAGGARRETAERRATRIAERLADVAARARDVVAVIADAGPSRDGETVSWPQPVWFSLANSGQVNTRGRLNRYLDPDYERALHSLEAANVRASARREADRRRRVDVACRDPYQLGGDERSCCRCVYCRPLDYEHELKLVSHQGADPFAIYHCVCGSPVAQPGSRCHLHKFTRLVLLKDDPPALQWLVSALDSIGSPDSPKTPGSDAAHWAVAPHRAARIAPVREPEEPQ